VGAIHVQKDEVGGFPEGAAPLKLSLAACESYENEVVYLNYRPQA
jgi:hypothetical protein